MILLDPHNTHVGRHYFPISKEKMKLTNLPKPSVSNEQGWDENLACGHRQWPVETEGYSEDMAWDMPVF